MIINRLKQSKSKIVPLLFGVLIVTSFMYNYNSSLGIVLSVIAFILQGAIYTFYDHIATKKRILQYISILGSMAVILIVCLLIGSVTNRSEAIDFIVWFLSPQDAVEYSANYVVMVFIGINFFIASTVYYFTQVRYRMFITFLLMLIPLAIFTKEDNTVPVILFLPLVILFFTTIIVCGQNNLYEQNHTTIVQNSSYVKSIGAFVLSFMVICSAIPKPQIEANRSVFENMISADRLTNFLLSKLGSFSDTSGSSGGSFLNNSKRLYSIQSDEDMALKTRTFSYYDFDQNTWTRSDNYITLIESSLPDANLYYQDTYTNLLYYDRYGTALQNNTTNTFQQSLNPAELLNAIVYANSKDASFSKRYNLQDIPADTQFTEDIGTVYVTTLNFPSSFILNNTRGFNVTQKDYNLPISTTYSGILYEADGVTFPNRLEYSVQYYSKNILSNQDYAYQIVSSLNYSDYGNFLDSLYSLVEGTTYESTVKAYVQDYQNSVKYSTVFTDCNNEKITSLAQEITKDCNSDLEKATALEYYFIQNGYTYDAEYYRPDGVTIEDFLFNSKIGACYEYSTSMILLARAIGLPARYCEGFLVDKNKGTTNYIAVGNSHAFPEVYISGFGWCYFEPTQIYGDIGNDTDGDSLSQNQQLFIVSIGILILVVLTVLFIRCVYPNLYERYFRSRLLKQGLSTGTSMIVNRIKVITNISKSKTLEEVQQIVYSRYSIDISNIVNVSNMILYGGSTQDSSQILNTLLTDYIEVYDLIKQSKKEEKKSKKHSQ